MCYRRRIHVSYEEEDTWRKVRSFSSSVIVIPAMPALRPPPPPPLPPKPAEKEPPPGRVALSAL
jgi:hypothetical protein